MGIIYSLILVILATLCFYMGIKFFVTEKDSVKIRKYIFAIGLCIGTWCLCYGCIGFCGGHTDVAYMLRRIGIIGVNGYLFTFMYFVTEMAKLKPFLGRSLCTLAGIISIVDWWLFSQPVVDEFVEIDGWLTWYAMPGIARGIHNIYVAYLFFVPAVLGIIAHKRAETKRQKAFLRLLYVASLILIAGSVPDTFFYLIKTTAIPTSGMAASISFFVTIYGAKKLNAFDITISNIVQQIYESVNVGVLVFDTKEKLMQCNPCGEKLLNIKPSKQTIGELFVIEEKEAQKYFEGITAEKSAEELTVRTRGEGRVCSIKTTAAVDNYKEPYCFVTVVYDLTREEEMLEEVKKANKAKSEFLANMSHEIRTPLTAVLGMNEMIIKESHESEIIGYANDVQAAGKMLFSLINDVLDFSKIESGKMELVPAKYNASSMINDLVNMTSTLATEKNLEFKVNVNRELPAELYGDETRVRQVIVNLLTNAVKYTKKGSVSLDFDFKKTDKFSIDMIVKVKDSGVGIKDEDKEKLFDAFTRVDEKKNKTIQGTGLGLSITMSFVKLMGGNIELESEYGKGSTFIVTLPQKYEGNEVIGDLKERIEVSKNNNGGQNAPLYAPNVHILVVDDVKMNCKVFKGILKSTHIKIDEAGSGAEAIQKCAKNRYDLIFMDHMMPEMDGIECLHELEGDANNLNLNVPVISLTANAIAGMKEMYLKEGFADYLTKPIIERNLVNIIKKHLPKEKYSLKAPEMESYERPTAISYDSSRSGALPGNKRAAGTAQAAGTVKTAETAKISDRGNQNQETPSKRSIVDSLSEIKEINIDQGLMYCMEDEEMLAEIIKEYAAGARVKELEEAYNKKDYKSLEINLHALKGSSKTIGAEQLSENFKELEHAAKEGDKAKIEKKFPALLEQYKEILDKLGGICV